MANYLLLSTEDKVRVRNILDDVKKRGDQAIRYWTENLDSAKLKNTQVTKEDYKNAYQECDPSLIKALKQAALNIKKFALQQKQNLKPITISTVPGVTVGERWTTIDSVGVYVPAGRYPLPSTALMTIIYAKVAGVKQIIVCSPPTYKNSIHPSIIVAANIAGATTMYKVGGVQAIGAMAFGTQSIPKVSKIVGPGNKYVTFAKKEVFGKVGIDSLAGSSEVIIIADQSANPKFVAADLLAQAEHDIDAVPILISLNTNEKRVKEELQKQLELLPTKQIAKESITRNYKVIRVANFKQAARVANNLAPEHLEIHTKNPRQIFQLIINAGSCFLGNYAAEVFGDYCSGPSHVLPTSGSAKFMSGLSVRDFMKSITFHKITKKGALNLQSTAQILAKSEGLYGHANAAKVRL